MFAKVFDVAAHAAGVRFVGQVERKSEIVEGNAVECRGVRRAIVGIPFASGRRIGTDGGIIIRAVLAEHGAGLLI